MSGAGSLTSTLLGLLPDICKPACIQAPFLTLNTTHGSVPTFPCLPSPHSEKPVSPPERL